MGRKIKWLSIDGKLDDRIPITQALLQSVRQFGEFKGREGLYRSQMPQALETLRQTAIIQSAESSNRIEGVTAPPQRLRALMAEKTKPRDRSEQEIAGYRDVLNTIHRNYEGMRFSASLVLQLHRDLFKYTSNPGGPLEIDSKCHYRNLAKRLQKDPLRAGGATPCSGSHGSAPCAN